MTRHVGFIGLGAMGFPMAGNLLKTIKLPLMIHDAIPATMDKFIAAQEPALRSLISKASSPKQVAQNSELIVTMLPSSPHVESVYLKSENAIMKGLKPKSVCIDASTISTTVSKSVAAAVMKQGHQFVDAPVSGGVNGAAAGTLTFMVGGGKASFDTVKPFLQAMGKNVVHCGENGHGQIAKICNNMLLGISMAATAETLNLGKRLGMDPKLLSEIISTSSGRNWSLDTYNPVPGVIANVPSSKDYAGGFQIELMTKDMGLAVQAALDSHTPCYLGEVSRSFYQSVGKATVEGEKLAGKDFSVVYKWLSSLK